MIRLAILNCSGAMADRVRQIAEDTGVFDLVLQDFGATPGASLARDLALVKPDLLLIDVSRWPATVELLSGLGDAAANCGLLGFSVRFTPELERNALEAGFGAVLRAPFSAAELDAGARIAFHAARPVAHPNVLAFLPSKAGSGCSTVALNTAGILATELGQQTLLIEADRRSGVLSLMLGVKDNGGLPAVLAHSGQLTDEEWSSRIATFGNLDVLLADPLRPGPKPTWAAFFQLLDFVKSRYDYILVDLPELVNPATAELACAARNVFIVCEPELVSLKLISARRTELEAVGVEPDKISVLGNRWEVRRLTKEALEKTAQVPMYAALPNDYLQVKNAVMESRMVTKESAFGRACEALARRVSGTQAPAEGLLGALFRKKK